MTAPQAVKGMNDVLPQEIGRWQHVERIYARTMSLYGYREVRTPYVESTSLFSRAIGEATDVVEKEMYSFLHHDEPLTLRPEGTAGAARAYIEHSVHAKEPVARWWYAGPMFRAERPQRGRYRQFYQLGAELFGDAGPGWDAEISTCWSSSWASSDPGHRGPGEHPGRSGDAGPLPRGAGPVPGAEGGVPFCGLAAQTSHQPATHPGFQE